MVRVFHVEGKELVELDQEELVFFDGDVYVIDNDDTIYIWLGKDSGVDEKGVGAWLSHKIDLERRGEPRVITVVQGEEPEELKKIISFEVVDADTPGFLRHAKLDMVEYKLFKIEADKQTRILDEATVKEVPLSKESLDSDDVFVLDGNEVIFVWFGKKCNVEERRGGNKLAQLIDKERHRFPVVYYVEEGSGGKTEKAFYELLEKLSHSSGRVVSVEDSREMNDRVFEYEEGKKKKKGFWSRLFGKK